MKKIIIATRFYHLDWYQEAFINYYLSKGVEEIRIYCKKEDQKIIQKNLWKVNPNKNVHIIPEMQSDLRDFKTDWEMCKFIYADVLETIGKRIGKADNFLLAFPDHDEFIDFNPFLSSAKEGTVLFRTIFHEWYLSPSLLEEDVSAETMLSMAIDHKLKGKVLEMWGDPYYKDYAIAVTAKNIDFFKELFPLSGFHRLIHKKKAWIPEKFACLRVHHLKGIPDLHRQVLLKYRKNLVEEQKDDWICWHYENEYRKLYKDYEQSYKELNLPEPLLNQSLELINGFDSRKSVFDHVVVRQNMDLDGYSRPSLFGDEEQLHPLIKEFLWKK
jgi:hypothetical protein